MELEKRLGLYQVFLKIYEHNRGLLDEILQLENLSFPYISSRVPTYLQGVVQEREVYLITNLVNGNTQTLFQPQKIWIIGRDRRLALTLRDQWISRQHAALQYVENEGFYLIDLNSTNGTFINGEPVFHRQLLRDGDQIRLGSLTISFFLAQTVQKLEPVSSEIVAQMNESPLSYPAVPTPKYRFAKIEPENKLENNGDKDTSIQQRQKPFPGEETSPSALFNLTPTQRSEILDRFLTSRQTSA
ncbi:FHA domain-containing protein [Phormidium sp. LEGE 05292]|uniref:FHA domain-containing protein n=1 Tax=[Phormidium] sp. LEGE 05292 TaxID=767427 RepID=UPI001882DC51|nr:FHA domain-containing protein [Phormidium sp. LEGE 05292]MBE9225887.1 FHA domain-containing protein [Phormidium sp. LEGE 05292]